MTERATTDPGVRLRDVLLGAEFSGPADIAVTGCCADARQCQAGDVFIAPPGASANIEELVTTALHAGAKAAVVDRPVVLTGAPLCYVTDTRDALGRVCQALAGNPSQQLKLIGVAGSCGKTATSHLIASVLCEGGFASGILGSLGYFDGHHWGDASWTTPMPPVMASWLRNMVANGCSHAVLEVSSPALAHSRLAGLDFDVACITNVRRPRLTMGAAQQPRTIRSRLFDYLVPEGFAILNADDDHCLDYLDQLDGPVLTVGVERAAELQATPLASCLSEQTYLLSSGSMNLPVRTRLVGRRNLYNGLVAAAVGLSYGLELPEIVRGLEQVESIAGRLERIECGQPFGVFVDAACSGDALAESLGTLRELTSGRVICVFGADGDHDRAHRQRLGRAAESCADVTVLTNHHPRHDDPQRIVADVLRGFERAESANVLLDRRDAIGWALDLAEPGDCVLIAGRGHATYQIIGDARLEFDDREVAREWLYHSKPVRTDMRRAA